MPNQTPRVEPDLRITYRCVVDDLEVVFGEGWARAYVDAHGVVGKFIEMRSQDPEGDTPFGDASHNTGQKIYTFHHFNDRGATWYQRRVPFLADEEKPTGSVVWLLGVRPNHNYDALAALGAELLPDAKDYRQIIAEHAAAFSQALLIEIPALLERAFANPGHILDEQVAGGLRLRVFVEPDEDAQLLTVTVPAQIPAGIALEKNWQFRLRSVLFGDAVWETEPAYEIGGAPLLDGESALCGFPQYRS